MPITAATWQHRMVHSKLQAGSILVYESVVEESARVSSTQSSRRALLGGGWHSQALTRNSEGVRLHWTVRTGRTQLG